MSNTYPVSVNLSQEMIDRLRAKKQERYEEEILDKIEQIEFHKRSIERLAREIEELSSFDLLEEPNTNKKINI